jgi:hypothetical protein
MDASKRATFVLTPAPKIVDEPENNFELLAI